MIAMDPTLMRKFQLELARRYGGQPPAGETVAPSPVPAKPTPRIGAVGGNVMESVNPASKAGVSPLGPMSGMPNLKMAINNRRRGLPWAMPTGGAGG